jgi:hypothetical protein
MLYIAKLRKGIKSNCPSYTGRARFIYISVGEVRFRSVFGIFAQTGKRTIRFLAEYLKPKPKPIETVYNGLVQFKLGLKQFHLHKGYKSGFKIK